MSLQTYLFRFMCKRSDTRRDAGLTVPDDIETHLNLPYGSDRKWQLLDIYLPKHRQDNLPVIVNFHGGGWVYGTKETYRYYCMSLAQQGFAVVNPSYRLAPKHRFPAAFEDINCVFGYLRKHADAYGLDSDRILGIGDSAGATGIAAYALLLTNPDYAALFPVKPPEKLHLRGIALNCGLYSTEGMRDALRDLLPKGKEDETLHLLDIPAHITADFPPCFLMTAYGDFYRDQPEKLIPALEAHGVRYQYKLWGDESKPLGHVFHCNIRDENAALANQEEIAFFKKESLYE